MTEQEPKILRLTHRPDSPEPISFDTCVFLKGYEPMIDSNAQVEFTANLENARTFASLDEMQAYVKQVDPEEPMRADGHPNRPVSAFSMEFCPASYFIRTATGWSMRAEYRIPVREQNAAPGRGTLAHFLNRPLLEHEVRQLAKISPEQHVAVLFESLSDKVDTKKTFVTRANKLTAMFDAYHQGLANPIITMVDGRQFDLRQIKAMVAIPSQA